MRSAQHFILSLCICLYISLCNTILCWNYKQMTMFHFLWNRKKSMDIVSTSFLRINNIYISIICGSNKLNIIRQHLFRFHLRIVFNFNLFFSIIFIIFSQLILSNIISPH